MTSRRAATHCTGGNESTMKGWIGAALLLVRKQSIVKISVYPERPGD
ncbi:hypothetical protein BVI434_910038 [Burkholderia vietnamiensis]|nr:hypothetical protein BVI434_910038 [Burkholderia vietnamiensis]